MKIKNRWSVIVIAVAALLIPAVSLFAQQTITIPASARYHKGKLYKKFWGEHYRKTWHTPVKVPLVNVDTLMGGLTVYEMGGSRQTKSLKARDKNGREYVLRSVDKTFGGALQPILKGTFIETIANDQVTISNPYGALVIAPLAEAAGILHTNPQLMYIPQQPGLKEFSEKAGNIMYMLEQRPDENWETAANFAYSKKIISTDKMLEKVTKDNDNIADQQLFLRSRLFDFFIGDWGRHEDQWRWAAVEEGNKTIYKPVPRDRDNAFTKFDGVMPGLFSPSQLQGFESNLKDVKIFAFTGRNLDRRFTAALSLPQWQQTAADLQQRLTDTVIEQAVAKMPEEVLPLLKEEYLSKLKSRRDFIADWATQYYQFINHKGVDITGSEKKEFFQVNRLSADETQVFFFKINKQDEVKKDTILSRIFYKNETKEIRLFGLGGDDVYEFTGSTGDGVKVLIVGADGKEIIQNKVDGSNAGSNIVLYDDSNHELTAGSIGTTHIRDTVPYNYRYNYYRYEKSGLHPEIFYNRDDRIYAGLTYTILKHKWNKDPFWQKHSFSIKYSIDQGGFSLTYKGTSRKLFGNWNSNLLVNYDQVRWLNFFGLGNKTTLATLQRDYYKFRFKKLTLEPSIEKFSNRQRIKFGVFLNQYIPLQDTQRYLFKTRPYNDQSHLITKFFTGISGEYIYQNLNDSILPVKGFAIIGASSYTYPLTDKSQDGFLKASVITNIYIPVTKNISIAVKGGAAAITGGTPELYQYNNVGGTRSIRGYQRERFQGEKTVFSQNELRWISDVRSYLFNGKIGAFAFWDAGRVWLKGEEDDTWHTGYGGGILVSPFNKITFFVSRGVSDEATLTHLGLVRYF